MAGGFDHFGGRAGFLVFGNDGGFVGNMGSQMDRAVWVSLMLTSYESLNGVLSAGNQAEFIARMESDYMWDTFGFGVGGQGKTEADFIYLLNFNGDLTARGQTKTGDTLRWDIDGTITVDNEMPAHVLGAGAGILTVTSTDGWEGVINWQINSTNLNLTCPKFNFPNANVFYISGNNFSGLLDISLLTSATDIWFHVNPLLTSFIGATSSANILRFIGESCGMTGTFDISGYSGMGGLFSLGDNPLTNIILPNSSQTFNTFYLSACPNLNIIGFTTLVNLTQSSADIAFISDNYTAAEINEMLVMLDNMSTIGFTCTISCGGTNAAPDAVSGGFNGLAAKASLIAKGRTVNTN